MKDILIAISSYIKFNDTDIPEEAIPRVFHREIIEGKLIAFVMQVLHRIEEPFIRYGVFKNFDNHILVRQSVSQATDEHLVRNIDISTMTAGNAGNRNAKKLI